MKKKKKSAFAKILEMIAPAGMSAGEYILHCSVNGVNADPLDVAFSEWLIKESFMSDADFYEKVGDLIAESMKNGELLALPAKMESVLEDTEKIKYLASRSFNRDSIFFIGRNLDYALGLEGSLKLKEISYVHCEAYAAG